MMLIGRTPGYRRCSTPDKLSVLMAAVGAMAVMAVEREVAVMVVATVHLEELQKAPPACRISFRACDTFSCR